MKVYCEDCKHGVDWGMTFFGMFDRTCYPILWHYVALSEEDGLYFDEKIKKYGPHTYEFNVDHDCHYYLARRKKRKEKK